MKKRLYFILAGIIFPFVTFAHSGDTVYVEQGTSPVIDGVISAGEWDDAEAISFTGYNGITITCRLKHNASDTLYIAQDVPVMSGGDHGYIWFDTDNDGGTAPKTDDFWLSSYYFDGWPYIESLGTGTNWGTWVSPTNWYREHTGEGWSYDHGQMEFAIAFNKIGITAGIEKTIGFMIGFGDNPDETDCWFWPSLGYNHKNPNAWADLIFYNQGGELPPEIISQPENQIINDGENAIFGITATGADTYRWQENTGTGFENITDGGMYSGAETNTLTITGVSLDMTGYQYQCVATNTYGNTTSNIAVLTVSTSIETIHNSDNVIIYPNPSNGIFTIEVDNNLFNNRQIQSIEITNISGQIIKQYSTFLPTGKIINNHFKVDLSEQPKGIYFIKILYTEQSRSKTDKKVYTDKIIIK